MATNNDCFICAQSRKKHKSSVICIGCQKPFCKDHHQEHRKSIEKDFDGLIEEHNSLRQNLYNENNKEENNRKSFLLKKIDDWEKEMITNIKTTAETNRTYLTQLINQEKELIKTKFKSMADELKTNQSNSDYVETDIREWQKQLSECKQQLDQLQKSNNDLVSVDINTIDWNSSISIQKRKEVFLRSLLVPPSAANFLGKRERKLTCLHCYKSFYRDSGYDQEYCSITCKNNTDRDRSSHTNSDDNTGDGCFHGNCIVSLANGLSKLVKDVRKGDVLQTPTGMKATVNYVVKILRQTNKAPMAHFDDGLIITPWHPIRMNGQWTFSHDVVNESLVECHEMYNFVLDSGHIVIVNGIECVTLGHGFKGEVIEHPYYGTNKVVDDLRALDVLNNGFIELSQNSTVRDSETGLVSRICRFAEPAKLDSYREYVVLLNQLNTTLIRE